MRLFDLQNKQPGDYSEEGIILPAPDACSDRINKACRYGLYAFILIALAAVLFYAAKAESPNP